ncbi:hypothetical protein [Streptomyces avicenniae]|nr:hypothetical protein [Streptomyces avicenniae]
MTGTASPRPAVDAEREQPSLAEKLREAVRQANTQSRINRISKSETAG